MPEPVSTELRVTANEIALGNNSSQAFRDMADRVGSSDARFLALAVAVQDETGGSLIGTFRRLSSLVRQRIRLRQKVESIVSGPRLTVRMLLLFPVFIVLMLSFNNPELLAPLWREEAGRSLLLMSLTGIAVGILSARYLARQK